jgi:hypothetical protein
VDRRTFLTTAAATSLLPGLEQALGGLAVAAPGSPLSAFDAIEPSDQDDLRLPPGFVHDVVLKWGDSFTAAGEPFGYNNDWIGVFDAGSREEAILVVNHEYISLAHEGDAPLYPRTFELLRGRTPTVDDYKQDVGVSVLRVKRDPASGAWRPVLEDRLNRRITARTPCNTDGPAAALLGSPVEGTFDNCAGQTTPWGTALSCEENFQNRVPELTDAKGRHARGGLFDLPGGHYGWVVEVDPYDPGSAPVKHTALGRFRHENVGLRAEAGKPVAGYLGDDRTGGHVWKFVSDELYRPGDRDASRRLLSSGRLYAARFNEDGTGEWRLLDLSSPLDPNPDTRDRKPFIPRSARTLADCYETLGAALMDAYQAANALGATPSGRPEDLEVHPRDGSVFIAFTATSDRPGLWENAYGQIWRLEEEGGDVRATRFRWSRFAVGGPADPARGGRVFAHPDNLIFDSAGDLWVATDISATVINARDDYRVFKNSGLFRIPVAGRNAGTPLQLASLPCEAEATGPAFAPGEAALFLSVQHPGERHGVRMEAGQAPRGSNWPHRKLTAPPQPAVVAIRRR